MSVSLRRHENVTECVCVCVCVLAELEGTVGLTVSPSTHTLQPCRHWISKLVFLSTLTGFTGRACTYALAPKRLYSTVLTEMLNSSVRMLSEQNSHSSAKARTAWDEMIDTALVSAPSRNEVCSCLVQLSLRPSASWQHQSGISPVSILQLILPSRFYPWLEYIACKMRVINMSLHMVRVTV